MHLIMMRRGTCSDYRPAPIPIFPDAGAGTMTGEDKAVLVLTGNG